MVKYSSRGTDVFHKKVWCVALYWCNMFPFFFFGLVAFYFRPLEGKRSTFFVSHDNEMKDARRLSKSKVFSRTSRPPATRRYYWQTNINPTRTLGFDAKIQPDTRRRRFWEAGRVPQATDFAAWDMCLIPLFHSVEVTLTLNTESGLKSPSRFWSGDGNRTQGC